MSKEIYIPVNGIAHKVTKVYAPVNGVARSVKKIYKGVNGIARQVFGTLDSSFGNNSWESIIVACQMGTVPDTWAVGDQMPITIGGVEYMVDIIGKNHDNYADGSGKAPLTFQLHDCYATQYMMHNVEFNYWVNTDMRLIHLPALKALLPAEIQNALRKVNKSTTIGSKSTSIKVSEDELFLLSEIEVYGSLTYSQPGEGEQYAYYKNGGSKVKYRGAYASRWWTRSPVKTSYTTMGMVSEQGVTSEYFPNIAGGVAFAFCF